MALAEVMQDGIKQQGAGNLNTGLVPAVVITRGDSVESVHHAAGAVVDHEGRIIASLGDPDFVTFSRSSLKPLQALAAVVRGYPERFGLTDRHLALACASHSGEERHTAAAQEMLAAIHASVDDLQCGTHIPIYLKSDDGPVPPKSQFSAIHNNCSGKHSGMLALARILDVPLADYLKFDAPVQTLIRETIGEVTGMNASGIPWATDGCSAPNYALPLSALARGFARYAWAAAHASNGLGPTDKAAAKIAQSMMSYPEMISGTGRLDLQLAEGMNKSIFAKTGGEAVECIGIPAKGWGIAIKIADGGARALGPLMVAILDQLGVLDREALIRLKPVSEPSLKNVRGIEIGTARCIVRLTRT